MTAHRTLVDFHDPYTRRSIELVVELEEEGGELLDTPRVVEVAGFLFRRCGRGQEWVPAYFDPHCYFEVAEQLLDGFRARLETDPALARWLRAATFAAAFGAGFPEPEPEPDRAERSE